MQRIRLTEAGWDRDLQLEPNAESFPAPGGRDVLVDVAACGVCYRDLIDRAGRFPFMRLPVTPGHEAVGRVSAVGPEVKDFQVGDRVATMHRDFCGQCESCERGDTSLCTGAMAVLGLLHDGGYATQLAVPERALFPVPDGIPDEHAAIMHCTFGTAHRGLARFAGVKEGMRVLITGANGGVGCAAVQVAVRLGAQVVAVVRDGRHEQWLRGLGAEEVLVDKDGRFHKQLGERVHAVLDCVGPPTFNASLRSLRLGGKLVVVGNVVADRASLNLGYVITQGIHVIGSSGATRKDMARVFALYEDKPFEVTIDRTLPLARADEAQRLVKAGGLAGRIVLDPTLPAE